MSEVDKSQDQAEGLRTKMIDEYKQVNGKYPPRSEIHKGKDQKTKRKMKYPIIRILALFFILLPVFILSMNLYYGSQEDQSSTEEINIGEDRVYVSKNQQAENQSTETIEQKQDSAEDMETEAEGNTEEGNNNEVVKETSPTKETTEKQDEKEDVNSSSAPNKSTQSESNEKNSEEQYKEIKTHKVAEGETLFSIAIKYYNSRSGEEIIRQYNNLIENEIYKGQILKIPIK